MARTVACSKFEPSYLLVLLCFSLNLIAGTTAKEQRDKLPKQAEACNPPLFVLGASLLDVGENAAAMPGRSVSEFPPYGVHYFGRPAARFSNGRMLSDFISQGLGYGFWNPFLKSLGSNFKHGVNFASSGATARNSTIIGNGTSSLGLFSLNVQIDQFIEFKRAALRSKATGCEEKILTKEDISEGVYFLEFGLNDYINYAFGDPNYKADVFAHQTISYFKKGLLVHCLSFTIRMRLLLSRSLNDFLTTRYYTGTMVYKGNQNPRVPVSYLFECLRWAVYFLSLVLSDKEC